MRLARRLAQWIERVWFNGERIAALNDALDASSVIANRHRTALRGLLLKHGCVYGTCVDCNAARRLLGVGDDR